MLKNPLQITWDLGTWKGFFAWPLCDLTRFSTFHFKCIKNLIQKNHVLFKTYGFAIREWLSGMGTILAKLLHKYSCICHPSRKTTNLKHLTNYLVSYSRTEIPKYVPLLLCQARVRAVRSFFWLWWVTYYPVAVSRGHTKNVFVNLKGPHSLKWLLCEFST